LATGKEGFFCERKSGREPDPRTWAAIEAKRKWLRGEIDNKQLSAAEAAASAAAEAAASAARAAASAAAWDAAWDAATAAQNVQLEARLTELMPSQKSR
jgi:hypothetical protein